MAVSDVSCKHVQSPSQSKHEGTRQTLGIVVEFVPAGLIGEDQSHGQQVIENLKAKR
jgi:hypothetical protein